MSIKITALPFAVGVIPTDILPIVQFGLPDVTKRVSVALLLASVVPNTRIVDSGAGLTGGGDLSVDRIIDVGAHPDGSIVVNPDDIQVGVLATDAQHGVRGGGTQHAVATAINSGFMSPAMLAELIALTTSSIGAGAGLTGGGLIDSNPSIDVVANADGSIVVNPNDIQVGVLATDAQHGVRGGGTQHAVATAINSGFMSPAMLAELVALTTSSIGAGAGLTGGGLIDSNPSIDVVANADGSIVVNPNDIQVGVLATDVQHGVRGGGTQHALVVPAGAAGFMSGADKTKLDGLTSGANSAFFMWGNQTISPTTTVRWLDPSYNATSAGIVAIVFATPIGGTVKNMRVTQVGGGNGNLVNFTLFVNGVATALVVTMASTAVLGTNLINSAVVVAGDLLELRVTKAINIGAGPTQVIATMLLQGP
jgi:hypothetical protein